MWRSLLSEQSFTTTGKSMLDLPENENLHTISDMHCYHSFPVTFMRYLQYKFVLSDWKLTVSLWTLMDIPQNNSELWLTELSCYRIQTVFGNRTTGIFCRLLENRCHLNSHHPHSKPSPVDAKLKWHTHRISKPSSFRLRRPPNSQTVAPRTNSPPLLPPTLSKTIPVLRNRANCILTQLLKEY